MNPILRNIFAVVAGIITGSTVNMLLIELGNILIPVEGYDMNTMDGLTEAMASFTPKNFIFPFLAHAGGTLVGALLAALIAVTHKMKFAMAIGALFLLGGIAMVTQVPSPLWFSISDLLFAYIPMAFIGGKLGVHYSKKS